ncbi:hypothetical protein HW115_18610 [Verrucomicrobiaceae bacterium N1E253]|uniref:Uncharacterized protein n=1 Tax=Oceaniferula marina TaxID=2748318 RepID=A0A851GJX3_9BACT|nr:hypothetical protein [Oceaniferula marina]NWK57636.1 hypothetical protein [Oceaniferula marina]
MKKRVSIVIGVLLFVVLGITIYNQNLKAKATDREATIVSIYYLAICSLDEDSASRPQNIEELLVHYGGSDSVLLEPFEDGLSFELTETGFILAEPKAQRISLFKRDRIVADERKWPHWKASGEYARKHGVKPPQKDIE